MALKILAFDAMENGHLLAALDDNLVGRLSKGCGAMVARVADGFRVDGLDLSVRRVTAALERIAQDLSAGCLVSRTLVDAAISHACHDPEEFRRKNLKANEKDWPAAKLSCARPRTSGQARYLQALNSHELVVCSGPPGAGKTLLAIAAGLAMLDRGAVDRIALAVSTPGVIAASTRQCLDELGGKDIIRRLIEDGRIFTVGAASGEKLSRVFALYDDAGRRPERELVCFLRGIGAGCRTVVLGDDGHAGFAAAAGALEMVAGVAVVRLSDEDVAPRAGVVCQFTETLPPE